MATLGEIREGLETRLATIDGLRVTDFQPDSIRPPIGFVFPQGVEFDLNANRGLDQVTMICTVIVARADDRISQKRLDEYVFGTKSVKTAIEGDRTLGGRVNTVRVTEMRNYGQVLYGDVLYLAAEFVVEVWV